jgi:hypothetical protein
MIAAPKTPLPLKPVYKTHNARKEGNERDIQE